MENFTSKNGVSFYAYKGDAMTLLAFDLAENLTKNFVGFSIKVVTDNPAVPAAKREFYIYNRMKFPDDIKLPRIPKSDSERLSTEFSPIQKFRWVHVPSTIHFVENPYFGEYTYEVTPRYIINKELLPPDANLTVKLTINVSPFKDGDVEIGFARAFISSQAFASRFGNHLKLRPNKTDLTFNIKQNAGISKRWNEDTHKYEDTPFTYEEIHEYLGWQAHDRVMDFLKEVNDNPSLKLDVFAYDLNEPVVVEKLLKLAEEGRLRIILDNYSSRKEDGDEAKFESEFRKIAKNEDDIFRGHFSSQAHSKVFIQRTNDQSSEGVKVLTGSTNFTTNGLYINANHTITFTNKDVAQLYADVFDASFGQSEMKSFVDNEKLASKDHNFSGGGLPDMTIRFSPHPVEFVEKFFAKISAKILKAKSDLLFAIMKDNSRGSLLDAVKTQVEGDKVFTYGITDERDGLKFYKPNSKKGIKISGLNIATKLPKPFDDIVKVPGLGHNIHHKFIVVDFKGKDPVVYCGSSNLAQDPEHKNGDNLLEIRDKEIVTAFAVEAIRLIDHFHWLNTLIDNDLPEEEMRLRDDSEKAKWYKKYYNKKDLKFLERTLLMK